MTYKLASPASEFKFLDRVSIDWIYVTTDGGETAEHLYLLHVTRVQRQTKEAYTKSKSLVKNEAFDSFVSQSQRMPKMTQGGGHGTRTRRPVFLSAVALMHLRKHAIVWQGIGRDVAALNARIWQLPTAACSLWSPLGHRFLLKCKQQFFKWWMPLARARLFQRTTLAPQQPPPNPFLPMELP